MKTHAIFLALVAPTLASLLLGCAAGASSRALPRDSTSGPWRGPVTYVARSEAPPGAGATAHANSALSHRLSLHETH